MNSAVHILHRVPLADFNLLYYHQTVFQFAIQGRSPHLSLLGFESLQDEKITLEALEMTQLTHYLESRVSEISGGEKQRVLLARALAQRPRLLLLDEPTAFLDLKHRLAVYALLTRLNRDLGITVVVVSHDINLAARHCDRVVLLHRGAVAADGPPDEVLTVDNLRSVYAVDVDVRRDAVSGRTYVFPLQPTDESSS